MKNKEILILLLSLTMGFFICTGCGKVPEKRAILTGKETTVPLTPVEEGEKMGNPSSDDQLVLLQEKIKEVIYQASKAAFAMCVQGFEEELLSDSKKPFSHFETSLIPWYSEAIRDNLEKFYDNHLGEWGYEMAFAFPLHSKPLVDEGFLSLEQKGETQVLAKFTVQTGHEETDIALYTLEKQPDGRWLITHMH